MKSLSLRVLLTHIAALLATLMPLPAVLQPIRPPWILLLLLYAQFFLPQTFYLAWVVILGLCLDVLQATLFGQHALALLVTTWIASGWVQTFHFFTIYQQMVLVALFGLCYQFLLNVCEAICGHTHGFFWMFGVALVCLISWPWIRFLADRLFINYRKMNKGAIHGISSY